MTEATATNSGTTITETKFTAAQIEENCPVMLQDLGRRIAVHSEKAQKCEDKVDQHYTTIAQLLATAHRACEEEGFHAFREKFIPNLGKSRVYELLAIGTNKKSVEEARASTRARVAKHRAKKAEAPRYVTVTDNSEQQEEPKEPGEIEARSIESEQTPEPPKPRSPVKPGDEAIRAFTGRVMELDRRTAKRPPERFSATVVPVEVLARLGKLLTDVANLKKSNTVEATPGAGIGTVAPRLIPISRNSTGDINESSQANNP